MTNVIIIFIHLLAAGIALGSLVYCLKVYLPEVEKGQTERDENSPAYKIVDLMAPTVFACLLVLIGSGIYFLLENYSAQVGLKPGYYNLFGIKMVFVAGAFFTSMYVTFSSFTSRTMPNEAIVFLEISKGRSPTTTSVKSITPLASGM